MGRRPKSSPTWLLGVDAELLSRALPLSGDQVSIAGLHGVVPAK